MGNKKVYQVMVGGCLVFCLGQSSAWSQSLKIDAEIRTRGEYRAGFQKPLADSLHNAAVGLLRTRVSAFYEKDKVMAKVVLQDSRIYGQTGINSTNNSLGFYEAWGGYQFTPAFSLVLGRQSLEYDDKRLFSAANWSNTGNAHDLALLKYEKLNGFKLHWGTAWNNAGNVLYESEYSISKSYKMLNFLWMSKSFGSLGVTALWINDAFQRGTNADLLNKLIYRNTVGGNVGFKKKTNPYSFYATAYYQFGHNPQDKSLRGLLLALKNQFALTNKWTATLGGDYLSGSKHDLDSGKDRTFNKLYGVNHSFNGSMEYWATLPTQGLIDIYGGFTYKASSKWNMDVTFHTFSLAQELSMTTDKGLGSELDITLNYSLSPELALQGGWSGYFKTDQTDRVKSQANIDTKFPHWAYVMLTFKPAFLNKK